MRAEAGAFLADARYDSVQSIETHGANPIRLYPRSGKSASRVTFWGTKGAVTLLHGSSGSRVGTNSKPLIESWLGELFVDSV